MNNNWWSNSNTLATLFWFRSVLIIGQVITSLLAKYTFAITFDASGVNTVIAILIGINIATWLRSKQHDEVATLEIFLQLLVDLVALSALFYFAGGAANPFTSMYLLPLAVGSILLPQLWLLMLASLSVLAYAYLMWFHPEQHSQHNHQAFNLHLIGMWVSFVLSAGVIALFVVNMRSALQHKDQQLVAAREQAMKDEKLVSLGTLAASTAHEMGTPLATIQLICSDLRQDHISQKQIEVLTTQVQRCKQALTDMSAVTGSVEHDQMQDIVMFEPFLTHLVRDWQQGRPQLECALTVKNNSSAGIVAPTILAKALINLLDNAADASPQKISVMVECNAHEAHMVIQDQGQGIADELINEIGTKPYSSKPDGIGLGAFLAHEIIQKMGGKVNLSNHHAGGVVTSITLPLRSVDV